MHAAPGLAGGQQCGPVHVDTQGANVANDSSQGPYESSEDAMVGVVNNTPQAIASLPLSSSAGIFGFEHTQFIDAWVPLFLFSVLFGLSMDYQVFLMSRMKERYDSTGSTREAVTWGVASTARIITGAALIIVAVFAGFASGRLVQFQQMGFGVAVALLLDATVIRSVVLPAALALLDGRSWYLPRWLEWLIAPGCLKLTPGSTAPVRLLPLASSALLLPAASPRRQKPNG